MDMPNLSTDATTAVPAGELTFKESIGAAAYEEAGIDPADVSLAEVYDLSTALELDWMEDLQLCKRGEAEALLRAGDTTLGGRIPVNPSGGLGVLRRGGPGPGARPGLRGDLAAARPGHRPPGRGRPGRHHRQPGPLRPRVVGDPQPLTVRPSRAASRSMAGASSATGCGRAERGAIGRQPLHQRQAVGDRALGHRVVDVEVAAAPAGDVPPVDERLDGAQLRDRRARASGRYRSGRRRPGRRGQRVAQRGRAVVVRRGQVGREGADLRRSAAGRS